MGWKRVYNFLGKDEKTRRNLYLLLLKTSLWKEVHHFFRTLYSNRNQVTTHPDLTLSDEIANCTDKLLWWRVKK